MRCPRVSRKVFNCDICRHRIEVGETYWRHALPPGSDLGNEHWLVLKTCGEFTSDCADYWTVDSREMARDPDLVLL